MKALKLAAIALVGLLVLFAIGLAVLASKFDAAWVKQELVRAVYEQKQRTLKIEGDLALSYFPSIGVKLGRASLSERNSAQEFATVDSARVSVRLVPLLSKQLIVERIELAGVRTRVVRTKEGGFNFDDLLATTKDESGKHEGGKNEEAPIKFDIAGIGLANSAVSFRDEKSGQAVQLTDIHLKTGRLANAASGPVELALKADGEKPRLNAAFNLGANYRYDLDKRQYAVEKLELKTKGELLALKELDAGVSAKELSMVGDKGELQVDGLALTAKSRVGGDVLEAKVDMPNLAILNDRASGQNASGTIRLAGKERQLEGKLDLSGLEGTSTLFKVGKIGAQWSFRQGQMAAKGNLTGAVHGNLAERVVNLPKLSGELDLAHPGMPMKRLKLPLDGSVHADLGKSEAAGSLATRFDESSILAKWQVPRFAPLAAGFDLAIDRLNIDKYFPEAPPAKSGGGNPTPSKEESIDLSFLRGIDLTGGVRIGFLQARNVKLSDLKADIRLQNGRLDVSPMSAGLYGGSLAGALSAQAEGNRVALRQTLNNVSIGPLLKDIAQKDVLEGRGQIGIDVATGGNSVAAMKQGLAGSANLRLRDGAIKGINLAKSVRQVKAMIPGQQDAVVGASQTEKTDFSELTATFRIVEGVARNDDLSAKSPFLRVGGAGNIDLARSRIDYLAKATIVGSAKGQEGKELEELKGLTVPVRLTGPFDNLSYRLEFGAMATETARQQFQKQIGKQLEKKDLGGALKGLVK